MLGREEEEEGRWGELATIAAGLERVDMLGRASEGGEGVRTK